MPWTMIAMGALMRDCAIRVDFAAHSPATPAMASTTIAMVRPMKTPSARTGPVAVRANVVRLARTMNAAMDAPASMAGASTHAPVFNACRENDVTPDNANRGAPTTRANWERFA